MFDGFIRKSDIIIKAYTSINLSDEDMPEAIFFYSDLGLDDYPLADISKLLEQKKTCSKYIEQAFSWSKPPRFNSRAQSSFAEELYQRLNYRFLPEGSP